MRPDLVLNVASCALLIGLGCNSTCECPVDQHCNASGECVLECSQTSDCLSPICPEDEPCCSELVQCQAGQCVVTPAGEDVCGPPTFPAEGWNDPIGSGPVFIVDHIAFSSSPRVDVDGRCDARACLDNALGGLGARTQPPIRDLLLGGQMLFAVEIAGLDEGYQGFDRSVTVKIYEVRDADDPFFPANNFRNPVGHRDCCNFLVDPVALRGAPETAHKRLPAQVRNGRLFTVDATGPLEFTLLSYTDPPDARITVSRPQMQAWLPIDLSSLEQARLSGVVDAGPLDRIGGFCTDADHDCSYPPSTSTVTTTLLDVLVSLVWQPDIDTDEDGLECVYDADGDGRIETCCVSDAPVCPSRPCTTSIVVDDPRPGACTDAIADGYSATLELHGVPAHLLGVGSP